ncbi:MAG: hypothetical protein QOF89_4866 [Acidobacteriota bacterium]|jgi:hypothetical protein|nr:hypothetical protein [Acidobacteriota bacterium]
MGTRELYRELLTKEPELAKRLDKVCEEALEIWKYPHLQQMTEHGRPHIEQVEANLDALTRPLQASVSSLEAAEIYVLLAACWLHDIGMQLHVADARAEHAQHSYELILHSSTQMDGQELRLRVILPIEDTNAREAIARVARAHWTSFALELPSREHIFGNFRGRLRLLGLLLAMADLLDLSPIRARYFRTWHHLYEADAVGLLHHVKHELARGFEVGPADPHVPGDLRFLLTWRADDAETRQISDWVLHELSLYWRQIAPELHRESGGAIRWAKWWAQAVFQAPLGPRPRLTPQAHAVLDAERAEQVRIDREAFAATFRTALKEGRRIIFRLPGDSLWDGNQMSRWCSSQARKAGARSADLHLRPAEAKDLPSIAAELMHQWGFRDLPPLPGEEALERVKTPLLTAGIGAFVTVIRDESLAVSYLPDLLGVLASRHPGEAGARITILLSTGAAGPDEISGAEVTRPDWTAISEEDIRLHLNRSWGWSEEESRAKAATATRLDLGQQPGRLYTFLRDECVIWDTLSSVY